MNTLKKSACAFLLFATGLTAAHAAPAVVINSGNGESPASDTLTALMIGKQKCWDDGSEAIIALLKDNADAEAALEQFTRMNESRFKSHWQRLAFSGRGTMPKIFDDADSLIAFVSSNKGAIGILDTSADLSAVKQVN